MTRSFYETERLKARLNRILLALWLTVFVAPIALVIGVGFLMFWWNCVTAIFEVLKVLG